MFLFFNKPIVICIYNTYVKCNLFFTLQADLGSTDMALALNRYLCTSVIPLLTKCSALFCDLEDHVCLVDSFIQAVYSLSRALSLTKAQRDTIEDCLLAVSRFVVDLMKQPKELRSLDLIYYCSCR